jgi:hypothetical protein
LANRKSEISPGLRLKTLAAIPSATRTFVGFAHVREPRTFVMTEACREAVRGTQVPARVVVVVDTVVVVVDIGDPH